MKLLLKVLTSLLLSAVSVSAKAQAPAEEDIATLIETGVKEHLSPFISQDGASEYEARQAKLDALIESASAAPITRNRRPATSDYQWHFKSADERDRKILELTIRKQLIVKQPDQWREPKIYPLCWSSLLNGTFATLSSREISLPGENVEFAQRLSDQIIHVYAKHRGNAGKTETNRYALHGLPRDMAESLEVGRAVWFTVIIDGVDRYESASGERSLIRLRYVPEDMLAIAIQKLIPKESRNPAVVRPKLATRRWTSADGAYTVQAFAKHDEYVKLRNEQKIVLCKLDGSEVTVPLSRLSKEDVMWAEALKDALGPLEAPQPMPD